MRQFIAGFVAGGLIVGGAAFWLLLRAERATVIWSPPAFYDDGGGYLHAQGSLIGEDMDGSTFLEMACTAADKVCVINTLQSIGPYRQVFLSTDSYRVTTWSNEQVVAESEPPSTACNRVRMVADRGVKIVHYYRIPLPAADTKKCAAIFSKKKIFDWTLGEQPV